MDATHACRPYDHSKGNKPDKCQLVLHSYLVVHCTLFFQVEPKLFFANERTFISWLHMSVILSSISIGVLAFTGDNSEYILIETSLFSRIYAYYFLCIVCSYRPISLLCCIDDAAIIMLCRICGAHLFMAQ